MAERLFNGSSHLCATPVVPFIDGVVTDGLLLDLGESFVMRRKYFYHGRECAHLKTHKPVLPLRDAGEARVAVRLHLEHAAEPPTLLSPAGL